jgi:hypothetical protein
VLAPLPERGETSGPWQVKDVCLLFTPSSFVTATYGVRERSPGAGAGPQHQPPTEPPAIGCIAAFDIPRVRSNPTHEKEYDEDDQNDADDPDASITEAVAVAAEATTEATKQENDEKDYEYESDRHDSSPVAAPNRTLSLLAIQGEALNRHFPPLLLKRPLLQMFELDAIGSLPVQTRA